MEEHEATNEVQFEDKTKLGDHLFDKIFPSFAGHTLLLDKYLSDERADFHQTYINEKMKFYDPQAEDRDWQVRECYTLLISGATEMENDVYNLWKKGDATGRRNHPDFGQYMAKNMFKTFKSAVHFCWASKEYWFTEPCDLTWDVLLPCLNKLNERCKNLVRTLMLILDDSMSGWHPKTTMTGGLPKLTWEPIKPVPLGIMFRNGVEASTGILVYQSVVQHAEVMNQLVYYAERSSLLNGVEIGAHTAEVLRQVEGAYVVDGRWVGGDTWFSSVLTAVEVKVRLNVDSTWIIKGNHAFYPMEALHAILKGRFETKIAGNWVSMTAVIGGVKLLTLCYAWSQMGVSYFLSTCGSTHQSSVIYQSNFEDELGNVSSKFLPRPQVCHFLYELVPLIGEHNKQQQSVLGLEHKWPTQCCSTRLIVTLTGMCVVDMHRLYRSEKRKRNRVLCGDVVKIKIYNR
jgi:hypothetical protein